MPALRPALGILLGEAAAPQRAMERLRQAGATWQALGTTLDELAVCRTDWYALLVSPLGLGPVLAERLPALAIPQPRVEELPRASERPVSVPPETPERVAALLERYVPSPAESEETPRTAPPPRPRAGTAGEAREAGAPPVGRQEARERLRELARRANAPDAADRPVGLASRPAEPVESFLDAVGRGVAPPPLVAVAERSVREERGWSGVLARCLLRAEQAASSRAHRRAGRLAGSVATGAESGSRGQDESALQSARSDPSVPERRPSALARFAASAFAAPLRSWPDGPSAPPPEAPARATPPETVLSDTFSLSPVPRPGEPTGDADLARRLTEVLRREASRYGIEPGEAEP